MGGLRIAVELAHRLRKKGHAARARELMTPYGELIKKLGDTADARAALDIL